MPEQVTGYEEWRLTLVDEIEALTPIAAAHGSQSFRQAKVRGDLRADAESLGHLLFTVVVREGDYIEMVGGATYDAHVELHELFADVQVSYRLRADADARQVDEDNARKLSRWLLHTITPGPLTKGAGRKMDDSPQWETVAYSGGEWLICTISIRAHVYVTLSTAVVPA